MATDIHLGDLNDERGRLLLDLIRKVANWKSEYFILCGDIFEFCQGSHPFFQKKFEALGVSLNSLSQNGCRVLFVEGNHEFDLGGLKWPGVEFVTEIQRNFQVRSGTRLALSHGDRIYSDWSYRWFRAVVKSSIVRWTARYLVPAKLLEWYTDRHSKVSRAADKYRTLDHTALLKKIGAWLSSSGATHCVFGHFHTPYFHDRSDGVIGKIISCESWDRPNALVMMDDRFYRLIWDRHTREWVRQPAVEPDLG
jgi:UDP-2,3-diacylglucosamine hydrolase